MLWLLDYVSGFSVNCAIFLFSFWTLVFSLSSPLYKCWLFIEVALLCNGWSCCAPWMHSWCSLKCINRLLWRSTGYWCILVENNLNRGFDHAILFPIVYLCSKLSDFVQYIRKTCTLFDLLFCSTWLWESFVSSLCLSDSLCLFSLSTSRLVLWLPYITCCWCKANICSIIRVAGGVNPASFQEWRFMLIFHGTWDFLGILTHWQSIVVR